MFWSAHPGSEWVGEVSLGPGFGLLDEGGGLVAACSATLGVMLVLTSLGYNSALADSVT